MYLLVCSAVVDIGIFLDDSGSIAAVWPIMLDFIQQVITSFTIGPTLSRVALIRFSSSASLEFGFSRYSDSASLSQAVGSLIHAGGGTNYIPAFTLANNMLWPTRRANVKTICFFITDGQPSDGEAAILTEVSKTKNLGIDIYTIGVNAGVCPHLSYRVYVVVLNFGIF
jgi:uncharacterized protein YegL